MIFRLISRAELPSEWPRLSKLLQPAVGMGRGELEVDDILERALEGRMFVFADDSFALTCEFVEYPRKTVMVVGFGSGKVKDYSLIESLLKSVAKLRGATAVQAYCKNPAMVRYFRRWLKLDPVYTVLEKQL